MYVSPLFWNCKIFIKEMNLKQGKKTKQTSVRTNSNLVPIGSGEKQPKSLLKEEKSKIVLSKLSLAKQIRSIEGRNSSAQDH